MSTNVISSRISLLWRTIILITVCVVISQLMVYFWIQRSVNEHFEVMDAEILTHAAFNLRKAVDEQDQASLIEDNSNHNHSSGLDYDLKVFAFDSNGKALTNPSSNLASNLSNYELFTQLDINELRQKHGDKQFDLTLQDRHYRAIIINNRQTHYLITLPIDVHHLYLNHFNFQLRLILLGITLLLISVAALSVYWGFSPLATFIQKMKSINAEQLGERIVVNDMPSELRPLAESYNVMMDKLKDNFESLSRFSDNIAHELRTPIATLSTQTQVMLSRPRSTDDYIEQLHHQHDTLEHLSGLINNMLLLAKTQKGLTASQMQPVDMDNLLTKLIDYYDLIAEERGIHFLKTGDFMSVKGDAGLLQRLFANLISNAIYYAKSDSIIEIDAEPISDTRMREEQGISSNATNGHGLVITMSNQLAEPMTQAEANKLFERFHRHTQSKDRNHPFHAGTGLGLSIVKSIVMAHGGEIDVSIKQDTRFEIRIFLAADFLAEHRLATN